ncbi:MAG: hypothetical protein ACPG4K_14590 [Haloferula sp.]
MAPFVRMAVVQDEEEPDESEEVEYQLPRNRSEEEPGKSSCSPAMIMMGVVATVALLVVLAPMIKRQKKAADRTSAISSTKGLGLAMLEFDQEYGCFPLEDTVEKVQRRTETELDLSGHSSNALFRQLIAFGVQSEEIFWCRHPELTGGKPDNDIAPGKALVAGEVGFSYLAGFRADMNPGLPVLLAPMKIGTETFHSDVFDGKAVILRLDNSAEAVQIRADDGTISLGGDHRLFDPDYELWPDDYSIDLRHPEK